MSDKYLAVLKVVYDYEPQSEDEIEIKEDQILFLIERIDDDWWKVKHKPIDSNQDSISPVGLVPAAYVEQAQHKSLVTAIYDYQASAPGELSIKEDDVLLAFDADDEWLLAQSETNGKAGYVPASYVQEDSSDSSTPAATGAPALVIPDSPPKPSAPYIDPAERVAASKAQADDIQTWSVTHIDAKSKKKKGTLGVGNGAVFFASESDKTPVQKWQTAEISDTSIEKNKHLHITIGANVAELHFTVSSKDTAEAIVEKLDSSRSLSKPKEKSPEPEQESEPELEPEPTPTPKPKPKASVHFSPASPVIIPPSDPSETEEDDPPHLNGSASRGSEVAIALYDFSADGDDELTVSEGDQLTILEKDGDEWWKCRNARGVEGVVPASYLELSATSSTSPTSNPTSTSRRIDSEDDEEEKEEDEGATEREIAATRAAEEAARQQREVEEKSAKAKAKEKAEKDRKKREAQKQAEAAEAARAKRKEEAKRRADAASPPARPVSSPPEADRSSRDKNKSKSSPADASRPPSGKVRTWHDRSGQFRVEAAFLGFSDGKLRLHKVNGVIVEVPSEKMSPDDMRIAEKLVQKDRERNMRSTSDDDVPLAVARRKTAAEKEKKKPHIDWFDFFLNAGCDLDDCTRYTASFERDKIDIAILGDITDTTMRSLGLREGDIIRVSKHIKEKFPKKDAREEQIKADETLARALEQKDAPNLFASADGALKAPRRGRPTPSSSTPPASVDLISLSALSDQIPRNDSPMSSPVKTSTPIQAPQRSGSGLANKAGSGFDDDAWTNRPSSTKPTTATPPPAQAARAPSAPPAPSPQPPQPAPAAPVASPHTTNGLANTTESDIFNQLARLTELRNTQPQAMSPPAQIVPSPPVFTTPSPGMGVGQPTIPMGQIPLSAPAVQPTQYIGPRGPFAPVPANEGLLRPLVPTHTSFSGFVPTGPASAGPANISPFAGGVPAPPMSQQPAFLNPGFPGGSLMAQPTGYLMTQATGMPGPSFVQSNPTGFNPGYGQPAMNFAHSPPPVPPLPPSPPVNNTNPANIFAQMKSGTFAADNSELQPSSDRYDPLRPNPVFTQPTGYYGGYR